MTENNPKLLDFIQKLISYHSISPCDDGSLNFIQNYLNHIGFTCICHDVDDTKNLIAYIGNLKRPIFAFAGHVDVVPTGDLKLWFHDPFTLYAHNNRYYGRGIADMKGAVASFILACEKFIEQHDMHQLDGAIMILLTSDEEGSGKNGTPKIIEYLKTQNITINYCLVGEPTSNNNLGDCIKIGRRGSINATLTIEGKQGHVAYPHLCNNPIHSFADALKELINYQFDHGNKDFSPTSLQFTNINAGLGTTNVIPEIVETRLNIRYNNLHDFESIQHKICAILNNLNLKYQISWNHSGTPFLAKKGKLVKIATETITEILKITPELSTGGGTSDARFLISISQELIELGLNNNSAHQINENILQQDLYDLSWVYNSILSKIF